MPQLAFGVAFAAGAAAFGATAAVVSFAFTLGTLIGGIIFPTNIDGPKIDEFRITTSKYGEPIPVVYGTRVVRGNIIQAGPVIHRTRKRRAGLFASYTEHTYFQTFAVQLCEGPIEAIRKIWTNERLIYDASVKFDSVALEIFWGLINGLTFIKRFYLGTEDQESDPSLVALEGADQTPYRGTAYIVFVEWPLAESNNAVPQFKVEVVGKASSLMPYRDYDPVISDPLIREINFFWRDENRPNIIYAIGSFASEYSIDPDTPGYDPVSGQGEAAEQIMMFNAFTGDLIRYKRLDYVRLAYLFDNPLSTGHVAPIAKCPGGDKPWMFTMYCESDFFLADLNTTYFVMLHEDLLYTRLVSATPGQAGYTEEFRTCNYICVHPSMFWCVALGGGEFPGISLWVGIWNPILNLVSYQYTADVHAANGLPNTTIGSGGPGNWASACFADNGSLWVATKQPKGSGMGAYYYLDRWLIADFGLKPQLIHASRHLVVETDELDDQPQGLQFEDATGDLIMWIADNCIRFNTVSRTTVSSLFEFSMPINWGSFPPFRGANMSGYDDQMGHWIGTPEVPFQKGIGTNDGFYLCNSQTGTRTDFLIEGWHEPKNVHRYAMTYEPYTETIWVAQSGWGHPGAESDTTYGPLLAVEQGFTRYATSRVQLGKITLGEIVADILDKTGQVTSDDYDTLNGSQEVCGYSLDRRMSAGSAIEGLKSAYPEFYLAESEFQLKLRNQDHTPIVTVEERWLGAAETRDEFIERLRQTRTNETELPRYMDYRFIDIDRDQETNEIVVRRPPATNNSDHRLTVDAAVAMTKEYAVSAAQRVMALAWSERETAVLRTHYQYMIIEPGDAFEVEYKGETLLCRATKTKLGANMIFEIECVLEERSTNILDITSELSVTSGSPDVSGFKPSAIPVAQPPKLTLMDTAMLQDEHNQPGIYGAVGPTLEEEEDTPFTSAAINRRITIDADPVEVATAQKTIIGYATSELPSADHTLWDRTSVLTASFLTGGTFTSYSEDEILDDYLLNLFALKDVEGNIELLQFVDAIQIGTNEWQFTTLLRGRLGTSAYMSGHGFGDEFIMIDPDLLGNLDYQANGIGATWYYQAVSTGLLSEGTIIEITQATRRLLPYPPYAVQATRNEAGDIIITWIRQSRSPGPYFWPAPLFEENEVYEVAVYDSGGSEILTLEATAETATITAAQQVDNFGALQSEADVEVFQISALIGRGYGARKVV